MAPLYLGLDVAKATVDLASEPAGLAGQFPTDPAGLAALVAQCQTQPVALVVLEATGGFEAPVAAALAAAGSPSPWSRQVRDFARALGRLAKTDRIDAQVLALFGARVQPVPRPLPDEAAQDLEAALLRRRQLLEMLHAERQRLPRAGAARCDASPGPHPLAGAQRDRYRRLARDPHPGQSLWRVQDHCSRACRRRPQLAARCSGCCRTRPPRPAADRGLVGVAPLARDSGTYAVGGAAGVDAASDRALMAAWWPRWNRLACSLRSG